MGGKEQMEKNRVLIWGAGLRGKEAYRLFDRHNGYELHLVIIIKCFGERQCARNQL